MAKNNCINCGAKLERADEAGRTCAYCGTHYASGQLPEAGEQPGEPVKEDPVKTGCGVAFFLACLLLVVMALANKYGCLPQREPEYTDDYKPVIDSSIIMIDTANEDTLFIQPKDTANFKMPPKRKTSKKKSMETEDSGTKVKVTKSENGTKISISVTTN